jgi:hypothetical protein
MEAVAEAEEGECSGLAELMSSDEEYRSLLFHILHCIYIFTLRP